MQDPVETAELVAFTHTVAAGSLSRAAADLKQPRATISRRLARLEARLGVRLLRRTTRSLALTDAGEALYRHAQLVLDAVGHAEASVRRPDNSIRGELRVSVPPVMPPSFHDLICDFAVRHPDVRLQVQFSARHVELARDGYDVALRATADLEPGLIARRLASQRLIAVASPAYLAAHGTPATRRDLARHRCLMGFARGELPQTHWPFARERVHVTGALFSSDPVMLRQAALRGVGIALLPEMLIRDAIAAGELVQVLAGQLETETQLALVYAERELMPPQVRAFVDAVVAWAASALPELDRMCPVKRTGRRRSAAGTPAGSRRGKPRAAARRPTRPA
jgi:DNA-binding transcriptional LysR family regulator